jgi:hypothetical protein
MSVNNKPLIRRTFSQDRYEILIKRQKSGKATFSELTELDELVNRDPEIRALVIWENILMEDVGSQSGDSQAPETPAVPGGPKNLFSRIKAFLFRFFQNVQSLVFALSGQRSLLF